MPGSLRGQWQCQTCYQSFRNEVDLRQHIDSFKSEVESIQSRLHDVMVELQQALLHSGSTAAFGDHQYLGKEDNDRSHLHCPHPSCQNSAPYTQLKSLQRHYSTHISCEVTCPCCKKLYLTARKYETHLTGCLKKHTTSGKKTAARTEKRRLRRIALDELARIQSAKELNDGRATHEPKAASVGNLLEFDQTVSPWTGESSEETRDVVAGGTYSYNLHVQHPTHRPVDSLDAMPIGATANFAASGAERAALSNRYLRGPALTSDPMDWSYAYTLATPLYESITDTGSNVYTDGGIEQQGATKDGFCDTTIPIPLIADIVSQ